MGPNPYDARDAEEHAAVAALLASLPDEPPAREAYGRGAGAIELAHLVADRAELDGLKEVYLAGYSRMLAGLGGFWSKGRCYVPPARGRRVKTSRQRRCRHCGKA